MPDTETREPVLIRNYDYDPHLFESTMLRARWNDRWVMGTGDCLWGLLDGMNDRGLAVSLTFGGRSEVGQGFGIPVVIRYVLEVCDDVAAGIAVLRRLPHQLSYNITLGDRDGTRPPFRSRPTGWCASPTGRGHQPSDEVEWATVRHSCRAWSDSSSSRSCAPPAPMRPDAHRDARPPLLSSLLGRGILDALHRRVPAGFRAAHLHWPGVSPASAGSAAPGFDLVDLDDDR